MEKASKFLRVIIFLGLLFSSFYSLIFILRGFESLQIFVSLFGLFLVIFFVNRYLRNKYPGRFLRRKNTCVVVYTFLSLSLSFFILSYIYNTADIQWRRFVNENIAYEAISIALINLLLIFLIAFGPIYLVWKFYTRKKGLFVNLVIALIYVALGMFVLYLIARPARHIVDSLTNYYNQVLCPMIITLFKIIIGALPLGWFYELFIESVLSKDLRNTL